MTSADEKQTPPSSLKKLRQVVTLGALALALGHILFPSLAIDAVTLALLGLALVPWLGPLFKSIEVPGGWKFEFHDFEKAVERASEAGLTPKSSPTFAPPPSVQDPNLALVWLRIELERKLTMLASKNNLSHRPGLRHVLDVLVKHDVVNPDAASALRDIAGMLNSAAHGAVVSQEDAAMVLDIGSGLLRRLDEVGESAGPA